MKTCFATVIYKQAATFFEDLVNSLDSQTDKDFDILFVNDNYTTEELKEMGVITPDGEKCALFPSLNGNVILIDLQQTNLSIPETRIAMLEAAKLLGYDIAVLGDADDTLSEDRVKLYKKAHEIDKDAVFFYNNFVINDDESLFKDLPSSAASIEAIGQQNFLGLSNTGICIDKLSLEFIKSLEEGATMVFDWYLFSRILLDVGGGCLIDGAYTRYRIYEGNIAGANRDITKEYTIKAKHYEILSTRSKYIKDLENQLKAITPGEIIPNNDHKGYWWSDIQL